MSYYVWIWLSVVLITLFVEFMTAEIVSIWFFIGAFVSLILALCNVRIEVQCWVFIGTSLLFLIAVRPFLKKWVKRNEIKTNIDTIVGKTGVVLKGIAPDERGEVKVDSVVWSAVSNEIINEGEKIVVLAIEGNKLIVKAENENENIIFESKGE